MTTIELREHYAGLAMQALIAYKGERIEVGPEFPNGVRASWQVTEIAAVAFEFADAMVKIANAH